MTEGKGRCPHGEFSLNEGCPECVKKRDAEINSAANIAKRIKEAERKVESVLSIVKVKYYSETTGDLSPREYTYYSADRLNVGDIVTVPVRDTFGKAMVSWIDVSEAEIEAFKDKVKTIPAGSVVNDDEKVKVHIKVTIPEEPTDEEVVEVVEEVINLVNVLKKINQESTTETVIALRPGEDVEAHSYFEESMKLLEYAEARVIATFEDVKLANDDLSIISRLKRSMEAKKKEYLEPLKLQTEAIRDTYNYLMTPILEADKITRDKMLIFDKEQKRVREEQERINALRLEAAQKEMELKGELSESVNLVEVVPEVKRVSTDMGSSGIATTWKFQVIDFKLLPDRFKMENATLIGKVVRAGEREIPGVKIWSEGSIRNTAR